MSDRATPSPPFALKAG